MIMAIHSTETRSKSPAASHPVTLPHSKYYPARTDSNLHGFIHHPPGYPIEWHIIRQKHKTGAEESSAHGKIGLCFESKQYKRCKQNNDCIIGVPFNNSEVQNKYEKKHEG